VVIRPIKLEIRKTNFKNCKRAKNQILYHEIEPNPSKNRVMHDGDNPSFEMNVLGGAESIYVHMLIYMIT
jgi:hypothetical protein